MTTTARRVVVVACVGLVMACGGPWSPASPDAVLDDLEARGAVTCTDRVAMSPRIVTCAVDGSSGQPAQGADLTVGLTDDPATALRTTRGPGGPWIVGEDWIVIAHDDDLERMRAVRDAIGHGDLYTDIDEVPVRVDD